MLLLVCTAYMGASYCSCVFPFGYAELLHVILHVRLQLCKDEYCCIVIVDNHGEVQYHALCKYITNGKLQDCPLR